MPKTRKNNKVSRITKRRRSSRKRMLRGGADPNFEVVKLPKGFQVFHGSFYKVTTNLRVPYFTSQDILQSVAHLLVEMKTLNLKYTGLP